MKLSAQAKRKSFYACTDSGCSSLVSQRLQNTLILEMAAHLDGTIAFYVGEDNEFLAQQFNLRSRLAKAPNVDGVIFFRLQQFNYGPRFDFPLMHEILAGGYAIHFARELLSILTEHDLRSFFPTLFAFQFLCRERKPDEFVRRLMDAIS